MGKAAVRGAFVGAALAVAVAVAGCSNGTSSAGGASATPKLVAGASSSTTTTTTVTPPPRTTTPTTTPPPPTTTSTTPKPTPKPKPKPKAYQVKGTPCMSYASACADLSRGEAWLISDGKIAYGPVSITSGRSGHRTPTGTFHVIWKDKHHLSKEFDNAPMPNSVFFYPGDAFHAGSLRAESHGCIHLSYHTSEKFYDFLSYGDVVQVEP
ncbi:MAG: L,D-transpeptidase [Sciscionella sp.]|nr:L,D-transpeptidase [Sciscionella sp.]